MLVDVSFLLQVCLFLFDACGISAWPHLFDGSTVLSTQAIKNIPHHMHRLFSMTSAVPLLDSRAFFRYSPLNEPTARQCNAHALKLNLHHTKCLRRGKPPAKGLVQYQSEFNCRQNPPEPQVTVFPRAKPCNKNCRPLCMLLHCCRPIDSYMGNSFSIARHQRILGPLPTPFFFACGIPQLSIPSSGVWSFLSLSQTLTRTTTLSQNDLICEISELLS